MTSINPLVDLSVFPVTRQSLFDMWNTGALVPIVTADLGSEFQPMATGSTFSDAPASPVPGHLFWHESENVMFVYNDVIDDTGVSLWLAIGPDKFETAVFCLEAARPGDPLELLYDRNVQVSNVDRQARGLGVMNRMIGFCQSGIDTPVGINDGPTFGGETQATNSWVRCGVDGLIYGRLENQDLHPSTSLVTFVNADLLFLSTVSESPSTILRSNSIAFPHNRAIIGITTQWAGANSGNPVTEPSNIIKFMFAPRMVGDSIFT